jgi:hypothetical protein
MIEIATPYPHLHKWAQEHDILGWDNFLEGRVGSQLFQLQQDKLHRHPSRLHIKTWGTTFIQHVLSITHDQWTFRNARVHIKLLEHKTADEHDSIMESVMERLTTSPEELLPQHRHLMEMDFTRLGEGTTADRQYWIAPVDSARKVAAHDSSRIIHELEQYEQGNINHVTKGDPT